MMTIKRLGLEIAWVVVAPIVMFADGIGRVAESIGRLWWRLRQ